MNLNIFKRYKPAVFCVVLIPLKSMLVSAQGPAPQFWQLNNSPSTLIWDNTPWNNQVDNGSGTFTATSLTWATNGGRTNSKINDCKDIVFGGNLGVGAAGTVTLPAITNNVKSITFHPAASGDFTITNGSIASCFANLPVSVDSGLSPTVSSVFSGTNSFTKNGSGTLISTGANTYTGATTVSAGTLQIGNGGTVGSIAAGSALSVPSGSTFKLNNNNSTGLVTFSNTISGSGTVWLQGQNSSAAQQTTLYTLGANNSGFSGNLKIDGALLWNTTAQTQLGSATVDVRPKGTLSLNSGSYTNTVTLQDGCGWYHAGSGAILGGFRMEAATFQGNLILNNTTNITLGDNTGSNSAIGSWGPGNTSAISGVISGIGNLSMSRNTGVNGLASISLTGTSSNTYSGMTVVDGQNYSNLLLRKTGGALAIPANSTVWMGSNTVGLVNLRMGDDQNTGSTTGATRNQWDNQFGANVLMQFNNASGNWMRFDLQGTNQTLSGLNCGTTSTIGGGVVQNQNFQSFNPNNPATLTLNGSGNYVYNGFMRDQDNSGTTNKLNLTWSGTGTQTLAGTYISHTGTTTVNSGRLVCYNTNNYRSNTTINAGGTYEMNVPSGALTVPASYTINGTGLLIKSGTGNWVIGGGAGTFVAMSMNAGGLLDIQAGTIQNGSVNNEWANNKGSANVASGAVLDLFADHIYIDALTGSGTITNGNTTSGVRTLYLGLSNTTNNATYGVSGNTATFSGVINNAVGNMAVLKQGTGTQIFTGNNTYTGGTTISGGLLQVGNNTATGTLGGGNIVNNSALKLYRSDDITFPNLISGTGNLIKDGTDTVTLTADNTYTGSTTVTGGMLQVGSGLATGAIGTGNIIDNGVVKFFKNTTVSISSPISGTGSLISDLPGSQFSLGTPAAGAPERTDGPWIVGNIFTSNQPLILLKLGVWAGGATSGLLGATSQVGIWNSAGTLLASATIPALNPISADGFSYISITPVTLPAGANYTTGGQSGGAFNAFVDNNTLPAFTPNPNSGVTVLNNVFNSGGVFGKPVTVGSGSALRYFPVSFIAQAPTLVLNSASTFTGGTTINHGIVSIHNSTALGTGSVTVNSGCTLQLNGNIITNPIILNGGTVTP